MNILDHIAMVAKTRVEVAKKRYRPQDLARRAEELPKGDFAFEKALGGDDLSFICECKKASPSKGIIAPDYPYLDIARSYAEAGADAISVLTEPQWFMGDLFHLNLISVAVSRPCLRKDFTVDRYMIDEAKVYGASAVLLIASILTDAQIREYLQRCDELGLSALCEAHDAREIERFLQCGARVIGVNNRNLKDFTVNFANSLALRQQVPKGVRFVAESGVKTADDVASLREAGVDAVLIGEALMRAEDKTAMLSHLRQAARRVSA